MYEIDDYMHKKFDKLWGDKINLKIYKMRKGKQKMAKRKLLAGVLTSALFLGCLAPAGMVMAAETEVETVLNLEKEA